jgi:hypothetical protein
LTREAPTDFCAERGGSLVDESNPALQGFLSWELWRRHRGDPSGQYWLGAQRDVLDPKNWKWISGKTVTVSFWNLPGGNEDCARYLYSCAQSRDLLTNQREELLRIRICNFYEESK